MKFFYFLILILISSNSLAHECILNGTSAKEITIYNSCKADLSIRKPINNDLLKAKIKKLKDQNNNLKNQFLDLKIRLNVILNRVNSYLD